MVKICILDLCRELRKAYVLHNFSCCNIVLCWKYRLYSKIFFFLRVNSLRFCCVEKQSCLIFLCLTEEWKIFSSSRFFHWKSVLLKVIIFFFLLFQLNNICYVVLFWVYGLIRNIFDNCFWWKSPFLEIVKFPTVAVKIYSFILMKVLDTAVIEIF